LCQPILHKLNKIDKLYLEIARIANIDTLYQNLFFCGRKGAWCIFTYNLIYSPHAKYRQKSIPKSISSYNNRIFYFGIESVI